MMRSPKTAPDLVYEDTFLHQLRHQGGLSAAAGRLPRRVGRLGAVRSTRRRPRPRRQDGKTYGVPDGTDTRGLWFNKKIFKKAGLPADWQPKNWDEVLDAARTIKKKVPGVIPLNVYTGKGAGEAAVMQGFEMLLYGTGERPALRPGGQEVGHRQPGLQGLACDFVDTVYEEKLGPDVSDALDPNIQTQVAAELLPEGKLAIDLDGSWLGQHWLKTGGGNAWPEWSTTLGQAADADPERPGPRQGEHVRRLDLVDPAEGQNPDLAWKFIKTIQTKENAVEVVRRRRPDRGAQGRRGRPART